MKDFNFDILEQIKLLLDPIGLPIYSDLPDNSDTPFILMLTPTTTELPVKSNFVSGGIVSIELYSGTREWAGTIAPILSYISDIKEALKPNKSFVLDLGPVFQMVTWLLLDGSGLTQYSTDERLYNSRLEYEFTVTQI